MEKFNELMVNVFIGNLDKIIKILKDTPLINLMFFDGQLFRELGVYRPGEIETRKIWDFMIRNAYLEKETKYGYDSFMFWKSSKKIILESKL
jgi:hypothetical protein